MLLGRRGRRTKSGGGCEGFLVVFLRVGIPEDPVLLFPDGDGLEVKRVTREQTRRADRSEIPVIDQRAGEACEGVRRRGAFSLMALAACRRPVDPDCRVVAPFTHSRRTVLVAPGRPLVADPAARLAGHHSLLRRAGVPRGA